MTTAPEIAGIHVGGLTQLDDDGVGDAPVTFFPAEVIDALIASGAWKRGTLHGKAVHPPPDTWPLRWQPLADPPDG